ncbi:MAG: hypothetical protein LLF95_11325 [Bacteroidales bacterium]|nr:hypothetical protein [Bacteroidales bacterium]
MRQRVSEENKAISIQKAKVKVKDYPDQIMKDGKFNPICPSGYNFLTGYTDYREDNCKRGFTPSTYGKVNGVRIHNI